MSHETTDSARPGFRRRKVASNTSTSIRAARVLFATIVFVSLYAPLALFGLTSAANAQDAPAGEEIGFRLLARVSNTEFNLDLADVAVPLGALEVHVQGLGELASECTLGISLGVCSGTDDGGVQLVAINPTGWQGADVSLTLFTAATREPIIIENLVIDIGSAADIRGTKVVGAVMVETAASGPFAAVALIVVAALAVAIGLLVTFLTTRRRKPPRVSDADSQ